MPGDPAKLTDLPLFALLGDEERQTLSGLFSRVRFGRGELVFAYGDPGDSVYIVSKGKVQIFMEDLEGNRIVLAENGPGDVFGEISLLDGGPRTAGVTALVDSELLTLDRDDLLEFITRHPPAALSLLTVMGQRLRSTNELLRTHTSRNINQEEREGLTAGQRVADALFGAAGSWGFLVALLAAIGAAVALVGRAGTGRTGGLTPTEWLATALLAIVAVQGVLILMSRNRQAAKDRLKADLEYQFNLKAEMGLAELARKLDLLAESAEAAAPRPEPARLPARG